MSDIKKGVTAIIFDDMGVKYFLIMHRILNWNGWEFPKGTVKEGETGEHAVHREIIEETGLKKFKIKKKLTFQKKYNDNGTEVIHDVFLVEASMNVPIHLTHNMEKEHDTYLWTKKDGVMEKLTHKSDKDIFHLALEELKTNV
jgi:8-oxo-dGTP pyrophosphatase MutT (NUDIX family)